MSPLPVVRIDYSQADRMVLEALEPLDLDATPAGDMNIRAFGDFAAIDYDHPFVFVIGCDTVGNRSSADGSPARAKATLRIIVGVANALIEENRFRLSEVVSKVVHRLERVDLSEPTLTHRLELHDAAVRRLGTLDPMDDGVPDTTGAEVTIEGQLIRQEGDTIGSA